MVAPVSQRPSFWRHPIRRTRATDRRIVDGLFAVGLSFLALVSLLASSDAIPKGVHYRANDFVAVALVLAQTIPLAWRRRSPIVVLAIVGTAMTVFSLLHYTPAPLGTGIVVAFYSAVASSPRRIAAGAAALTFVGLTISLVPYWNQVGVVGYAFNLIAFTAIWILGDNIRTRRLYLKELEHRAELLEREREDEARRAVDEERARIARELHDVVAHHVSMMVVQAGGARRIARTEPARAEEALGSIETTGRQALSEMRRLLGVLRPEAVHSAPDLEPQPGLASLDRLVAQVREAGLPVNLRVIGRPSPLPSGIDLSAYRIVQEALTNTLKHAGPARAKVILRYHPHRLELVVVDDGVGAASMIGNGRRAGHGLVGMRERVGLYGGRLEAGPKHGGGYVVRASLPFDSERSSIT